MILCGSTTTMAVAISAFIESCDDKQIIFTGHSQGGAAAAVAQVIWNEKKPLTITFGQPPFLYPDTECSLLDDNRIWRFMKTARILTRLSRIDLEAANFFPTTPRRVSRPPNEYFRRKFPGYADDTYFAMYSCDLDVPDLPPIDVANSELFEHFLTETEGNRQVNRSDNAKKVMKKTVDLQEGKGLGYPARRLTGVNDNEFQDQRFGTEISFRNIEDFLSLNWTRIYDKLQ